VSIKDTAEKHLQNVKPAGEDHLQARCPFHHTKSGTPFSMNTRTGLWICFSCGASGSFGKFLGKMGYTRDQIDVFIKTARLDSAVTSMLRGLGLGRKKWSTLPEYVLGAYDGCPIDLLEKGFTMDTLQDADIGYDRIEDRITFPIRDYLGRLVAVSGRAREDWKEPRYKVYEDAFRALFADGDYEPKTKLHVYGLHSIWAERYYGKTTQPLVIVEGYKGCLWMRQMGLTHTVALMGSLASQMQIWLISRLRGPYVVLLDHEPGKNFPDEKDRFAAGEIIRRLSKAGDVLLAEYPEGSKAGTSPDDLTQKEAVQVVRDAKSLAHLAVCEQTKQPWKRSNGNARIQQVP